jgi:hypothetical protein
MRILLAQRKDNLFEEFYKFIYLTVNPGACHTESARRNSSIDPRKRKSNIEISTRDRLECLIYLVDTDVYHKILSIFPNA